MTGYLPYLIEKHGYGEESVIRWIENQLKRYSNIFLLLQIWTNLISLS